MKNNFRFILIGFIIFAIGFICFCFEIKDFNKSYNLTSNFIIKQEIIKYPIGSNETYRISNDKTNNNVNLYIDNNLSDEVRIVVSYPDISKIEYDYSKTNSGENNLIRIDFESTTLLDFDSISDIFELGVATFKKEIMYNYTLLKYPEIRVYVNEKYKENIEFVGSYGKVYNPIR